MFLDFFLRVGEKTKHVLTVAVAAHRAELAILENHRDPLRNGVEGIAASTARRFVDRDT